MQNFPEPFQQFLQTLRSFGVTEITLKFCNSENSETVELQTNAELSRPTREVKDIPEEMLSGEF